jgi:hypothetical protein
MNTSNIEFQRDGPRLRTGASQTSVLTRPNFSIIAADEKGIIQSRQVGAGRIVP